MFYLLLPFCQAAPQRLPGKRGCLLLRQANRALLLFKQRLGGVGNTGGVQVMAKAPLQRGRKAAVHVDGPAVDIVGGVAGQEDGGAHQVVGAAPAAGGNAARNLVVKGLVIADGLVDKQYTSISLV